MSDLQQVRVSAPTVIAWISAILSVSLWLAGWAIENRIVKLESGGGTMDAVTLSRFDYFDREHGKIDGKIDRMEERIDRIENRIQALESRQVRVTQAGPHK